MKTIPCNDEDHAILKQWCKKMNITFQELIHGWVEKVKSRKQIAFYNSLPDPRQIKINKPLIGIKLSRNYKKSNYL